MRIFDVGNRSKRGFWCAAPDEQAALEIALAAGHAKTIENLHATDITESICKDNKPGAEAVLNTNGTFGLCRGGTVVC